MDNDDAKRCARCGEIKSAGRDFHWIRSKNGTRRPFSYCKPCGLEARRENAARQKAGDPEDRRTRNSRLDRGLTPIPVSEIREKKCGRCGEIKPTEGNFYQTVNKHGDRIWAGYCIECTKAKVVEWQKANPEKKAAADKKQDQKPARKAKHTERGRRRSAMVSASPELRAKQNLICAAYRQRHPGRTAEHNRKFRERNPERAKAHGRKHYWTAPGRRERVLDHIRLRHAFIKDKAIYGDDGRKLDRAAWVAICAAFDNRCCYCGCDGPMTIEHLTPYKRGGRNVIGNLAPACAKCNLRKKAKTLEEFAPDRAAEIRRRALICVPVKEAA